MNKSVGSVIVNEYIVQEVKRMIVQLTGNVNYNITLDPTVWIFDDRKILFEEAFNERAEKNENTVDELEKAAERFNKEVYRTSVKPPVNKSITKFEREKILKNSYVMPLEEFLLHAEIKPDSKDATLTTTNGPIHLSLNDLQACYLLFAIKGKPVTEEGPVHLFFNDGSNKDNPITGIQKITINK